MKNYIITSITSVVTVLAPVKIAMIATGVLIFLDLLMGLFAAHKQGIKIESRKLKFTLVKMIVYQLLIISAFISEKYLIDVIPFVKITLGFIATVEFTSVAENFQKITGLPFFKFVKEFIQEKLNKVKKE